MVTFQMLRLYTLILTITIKDSFLWESKMILNIKNTAGRVKVKIIWIVYLKNDFLGRPEHLKNSSKILANIFSDLLAILKKKIAGWRRQMFFS
jgi:hypothetical protein